MKLKGKFAKLLPAESRHGKAVLPALVTALLAVAVVLRVGLPLWAWKGPEPAVETAGQAAEPGSANMAPDLAALQSLHLFDTANQVQPTDATPALNTALNLRLEGVILAGQAGNSLAVIVSGNARGSYRAGDELPAGANIRVDSIARDHVVIDNRGQREVLWLYAGGNSAPMPATSTATATAAGGAQFALPPGTDARVLKTAARLAEIISVSPEHYNGALVGYRLAPGARLKDFVNLGFQEGDIVTAVNGIALNDVANLPKLYGLMDGAPEVSFSLLRNQAPLSLKVTLLPENGTR